MEVETTRNVNCHNCNGACCRAGILLQLTADEAAFLREGGSEFEVLVEPHPRAAAEASWYRGPDQRLQEIRRVAFDLPYGKGAFGTLSNCGYLAINAATGEGTCTVYDDPRRPGICRSFPADSQPCNTIRRAAGVPARPQMVEISPRKAS